MHKFFGFVEHGARVLVGTREASSQIDPERQLFTALEWFERRSEQRPNVILAQRVTEPELSVGKQQLDRRVFQALCSSPV